VADCRSRRQPALHVQQLRTADSTVTKAAGKPTTPAMAAGIERVRWSLTQIAELLD
jgi:hypothetical protein